MPSYLLTWNPLKWSWTELANKLSDFEATGFTKERWSCGNTKRIKAGDRIYLIRLGKEPKGIVASGIVCGSLKEKHWDNKRSTALYVDIQIDKLINSPQDVLIRREELKQKFSSMRWDTQVSGISIPDDISAWLEQELSIVSSKERIKLSLQILEDDFSERLEKSKELSSKQRQERLVKAPRLPQKVEALTTVFLRNADVIAEVLARSKGCCESCGNPAPFMRASDSSPYLEVHHKVRLADDGEDIVENALAMCPNCHRKAHYG